MRDGTPAYLATGVFFGEVRRGRRDKEGSAKTVRGFAGDPLRYYDTAHGRTPTRPFAGGTSTAIERGVCRRESSRMARIAQPPPEPPPKLTPEEIQQRCNEPFGDTASRPKPTPPARRPEPSTPEEIQQRLNEALAGAEVPNAWPWAALPPEPRPKLAPEEIQQLNEAFAPWEWAKSHPAPVHRAADVAAGSGPATPRPVAHRVASAATRGSRTFSELARTA